MDHLPIPIHVGRSNDMARSSHRLFRAFAQIEHDRKPLLPIDPLIAKNLAIAGDAFHSANVQSWIRIA